MDKIQLSIYIIEKTSAGLRDWNWKTLQRVWKGGKGIEQKKEIKEKDL